MAEATKTRTRRARDDAADAREEAWRRIAELGRRAAHDRAGALNELQELFRSGRPSEGISGQTEGMLVTWTLHPAADRALRSVLNAYMPWLGKKFYPEQQRGENTLRTSARLPVRLLWPMYSTRPSEQGLAAFDFNTYVEPGRLDPSVDVLVIDYASVAENPRLLIRQIRDELVQIAPGAHLGKMLVSVPRRRDPVLGLYFALKSEI